MQGGNSLSDFFKTTKQAKYLTYLLASKIDPRITQANNSLEVKNLLQSAPVEDIIRYANGIKPRFSTVLEVESENSFLTRPVYESLENGDFVRVPTIIGYNSEECLAWYDDINSLKEKGQTLDGDYKKLVPNMPLRDNIDKKEVAAEIKEFYVGKNGSFADDLPAVLRWQSEDRFVRTTYKQAVLQSKYVPVYLYRFSFVGTPSSIHISIPGAGKVGHGADVPFFFNVSRVPLKTEQDFITRQRLVTLWSNFIKTSNPTPDDRPAADILENIVWRAASPSDVEELDIGDKLVLRKSKKVKELIFWDHIWNTYSYRPYNTF
ncbi:hypothetical protein GWI33_021635 [Rhynchophorus ferrugineus]|uniref:Carboxylesterase type B domain-containing protein n=1 Tax=Rhynchophorus ferrugineus TaxID=354439 RepID=A0A834ITI6_RHYFE|nr:hypothetical protein GWI33_021635 [Rhynchophorus ferrugineus]